MHMHKRGNIVAQLNTNSMLCQFNQYVHTVMHIHTYIQISDSFAWAIDEKAPESLTAIY